MVLILFWLLLGGRGLIIINVVEFKMADGLSLSELFSRGWEVQKRVESGALAASQDEFKVEQQQGLAAAINSRPLSFKEEIGRAIRELETATRLANELSLFSRNEELEEVATSDLRWDIDYLLPPFCEQQHKILSFLFRYLLLPALLGDLVSQVMDGKRVDTLQRAKVVPPSPPPFSYLLLPTPPLLFFPLVFLLLPLLLVLLPLVFLLILGICSGFSPALQGLRPHH